MKTAEDFFNDYKDYVALTEGHYEYLVDKEDFEEALIEFAKMHVEAALKEAAEDADLTNQSYNSSQEGSTMEIDKNTILNSYPLENIK